MSDKMVSEFQQNVTKMIEPELEQIRQALKRIERKLDLSTQAAKLVLEMSVIGFEPRTLEIELTSVEGKAQEKKKGPVLVQ